MVGEVGDGACLLRTIARRGFGNPDLHLQVRHEIISNIAQHPQQHLLHISNVFGGELVQTLGSAPRTYHSLRDLLYIISHLNAYAGYVEIAHAENLYTVAINVTFSASALPPFPVNPNHLHILYQPYSTYSLFYALPTTRHHFKF